MFTAPLTVREQLQTAWQTAAAVLTAADHLWGRTTGRRSLLFISTMAACAAGPSWGRRRRRGNANNCQRAPAWPRRRKRLQSVCLTHRPHEPILDHVYLEYRRSAEPPGTMRRCSVWCRGGTVQNVLTIQQLSECRCLTRASPFYSVQVTAGGAACVGPLSHIRWHCQRHRSFGHVLSFVSLLADRTPSSPLVPATTVLFF